jgi:AraC family transcriptional regulator, regulatory protein of adaptative response / DNA-3-methyladenine glycosylase II
MDFLDPAACYRAFQTRDRRFDGRVFCGVTSTGIYCRPICPARTPKFENCRYFATAAAAQQNGFRPCLRCRPEVAPELAAWRGTFNTVSRALALITEGGLDDSDASLDALAARVGVSARHLRRLFQAHIGASPIAVVQTRRVMLAKQLVHETGMSMTEIAQAAGFGSVRRFNETFQTLFKRPPSALRRRGVLTTHDQMAEMGVTLRVPYQPPYDWSAMLGYLAARAIDGVERVTKDLYCRSLIDVGHVGHAGHVGTVTVVNQAAKNYLAVTVHFPRVEALPAILARVKRVFDVSADIQTINQHLGKSPALTALVAQRPGLRAPGGWDGFELAIRAILGQQITVEAARRLLSQLVFLCGVPLKNFGGVHAAPRLSLTHAFPTPSQVAKANLDQLKLPSTRRETLRALAHAALEDAQLFYPQANMELAVERLKNIRGIGEWTAQYIALHALRETDAFPASDIALLRSATNGHDKRLTPNQLIEQSQPWRPWRAYAAQHLWAADAAATVHG